MKQFRMWLFCALLTGVIACGKAPAGGDTEPSAVTPLQPATIAVPGAATGTQMPAAGLPATPPALPPAAGVIDAIPPSKIPTADPGVAGQKGAPLPAVAADAPPATLADPMFTIRLTAAPTVAPGGTAKAKVTVLPGKGYKVNKEFPANLQMEVLPGVTFSPPRLERAAAVVDTDNELTFEVQMAAAAAGDYAAKGLLKFAVCDDANCVPKKQAFAVDLHVK